MPIALKRDAQRILDTLDALESRHRGEARSWWPKFVFHYTALTNAVSILETGMLYSRSEAKKRGLLVTDGASASVLSNTSHDHKRHARLYFRPKTPTQHTNEGIRSKQCIRLGAHCPVPVFFLFDSRNLLTRESTQFSDGSLAGYSPGEIGSSGRFFEALPFRKIYHNTWFTDQEKREIVARRHAEVIVPDGLDLGALKYIWCRSEAEKETLLSLLSVSQRQKWTDRIFYGQKYDLFFSEWRYVERVSLDENGLQFRFNRGRTDSGPFRLEVKVIVEGEDRPPLTLDQFKADRPISVKFRERRPSYTVELRLDEHLVDCP